MVNILYIIITIILLLVIIFQLFYVSSIKKQLEDITAIVDDMAKGNLDRRIVIAENSIAADLSYKINEVVINAKTKIVELKQAEKAYRQLVTSLSHDIRTPLASLTGYLEAIELGLVKECDIDHYLRTSLTKALDLQYFIDTLFEWLKLESGERLYHLDEVEIYEYIRTLVADWIPRLEKAGIDYVISIPEQRLVLKTDKTAWQRIFDNLMQNILNHSSASSLFIEVYQNDTKLYAIVRDDGRGIQESDLPRIFERLYKVNAARGVKGNGLGLAIVKELIKGIGGNITVDSKLNAGTAFFITLPLASPQLNKNKSS
jgi:signal transduction histidine kinase